MTEEAGMVYSTRQAAEALGVGAAMLRRYAQTLEEVTGEEIPQTRKDGRQFTQEHLNALLQAKALVDANNGLSVEAALRMVTQGEVEGLPVGLPRGIADSGALVEALRDAEERRRGDHAEVIEVLREAVAELRDPNMALLFAALQEAVTAPLVAELRELRAEITELRQGDTKPPALSDEAVDLLRSLQGELRKAQRDHAELLELRGTVAALEAERALPSADPETIDRALEVELEQQTPPAAPEDPEDDQTGAGDGVLVRAARWLEARLGRVRRG